jgi:hypothetical protein
MRFALPNLCPNGAALTRPTTTLALAPALVLLPLLPLLELLSPKTALTQQSLDVNYASSAR